MKKKAKTKKRNPQDLTLRNLRALKKRVEKLEAYVVYLLEHVIVRRRDERKTKKLAR